MYLKKLSVQGFKSFPNRTGFEFAGGVTSVVGPNGSGKSNVADAIRWVLGEQSSRLLRARKQEDVIFSGGSERAAVGMAEVLLTLDNSERWLPVDFAEIEIGRRVYRDGDSEYLLNGSRVRLRDITDLLMQGDVGQNSYTIMGQGLVDEVLAMNPEERRNFLDEAADVKRFRMRIKEAHDRLGATRENIDRVTLVLTELEPRLAQLSRQAARAGDHARLSGELMELLRTYYTHRWSESHNNLVRARANLDQASAESQSSSARVTAFREQLRTLSEEIRRRREAISRRDNRQAELEQRISRAEQAIAIDRERHAMTAARHEEVRLELEVLESERMSLASTDVDDGRRGLEVNAQMQDARNAAGQAREALDLAEREYAAVRSRAREAEDAVQGDRRRIDTLRHDIDRAARRVVELEREAEKLTPRRKQLLVEYLGYRRRDMELRYRVEDIEIALAEARATAEAARDRLGRVQDELRQYEQSGTSELRELDHLEGRLDALRRVQAEHDGVAAGTRHALIMGQALVDGIPPGSLGEPPEVPGIVGIVARQLRVPPGLEAAINAALEHRLHAVVVENEDAAVSAIGLLRERRHGRAQFIALDTLKPVYPLNLQKERGVVGVASKLVRCEPAIRPLVDTVLGRVIVCEDLASAQRMVRRALGTVVTLDGTYLDGPGILTGGATGADEGPFVRQRELEEIPRRIEELRERTAIAGQRLEQARAAAASLAGQAREAEQQYAHLRRLADSARQELDRDRGKLHRVRRDIDALRSRRRDIAREHDRAEQVAVEGEEALITAQRLLEEHTAGRAAMEDEVRAATARREGALQGVADAGGRLAAAEGERRALEALREQHEKSIERLAAQVNARRLQLKNLDLESSVINERVAKLQQELAAARDEMARHHDDAAPDHDELHRLEGHERQVQDEYNAAQAALLDVDRRRLDLEAEVGRHESAIEGLRADMEREGLAADRTGVVVSVDELMARDEEVAGIQGGADIDPAEVRSRIEEVRRQIRRLGPVNAEAPEDYRQEKERFDFLSTQMADLAEAEAQLREAIVTLNEEIRQRFTVTFERVNAAFGEYFTAFFGGGAARLLLTDPDRPGEAGIEIEASPPGKKIRTLSLLSGGERSLTAVALLFALLTVNPAPFCVLDEVDAALDEANVGRFTASLKKLAERTQFIVITHNRRTVEVADAIYGVSMNRDGVSKVLSLRLADLPEDDLGRGP